MSAPDMIAVAIGLNLVLASAVTAVLATRIPVRRIFGARTAYMLWVVVPVAMAASFLPVPTSSLPAFNAPVPQALAQPAATVASAVVNSSMNLSPGLPISAVILALWAVGMILAAAWVARGQRQFLRAMARGHAGPAVAGFLRPRLVLPSDFHTRFDATQRSVVLAHEDAHLRRQDARVNGLIAIAQCVFWFNPALHLGARVLRIDQELACDAVVAEQLPAARGAYAEAMLKTQLAHTPLPLGCYWPGRGPHPLTRRIAMLKRPLPSRRRKAVALTLVIALATGAGYAAWTYGPAVASPASPGVAISMNPPAPGPLPNFAAVALINVEPSGIYLRERSVNLRNLSREIAAQSDARNPATDAIYVRAHRSVPYSEFMTVLNRLREDGYANINLINEDL